MQAVAGATRAAHKRCMTNNGVDSEIQRGSNARGVRRYNARLLLAAIRRADGVSKADLARLSGLSAQAVSRIVDDLEAGGLVVRAGKRTGGMGQPAILYRVNGANGCTIGVEIGRTSIRCVLLNFDGVVLAVQERPIAFPDPREVVEEISGFADTRLANLPPGQREAFLGIGIAMPWFIGAWQEEAGIAARQAEPWRSEGVEAAFRDSLAHPLFFENDGNAAALAELFCGAGVGVRNFLHVEIGSFIGGGLVLDGQLVAGRHGNAAAIASMPVPNGEGRRTYLLHRASLYRLEAQLRAAFPWEEAQSSLAALIRAHPDSCTAWIEEATDALAFALVGANSLLDLDAIILGGTLPGAFIARMIERLRAKMRTERPRDFFEPPILAGRNGAAAAAIGAGLLPLHATYSPNIQTLQKGAGD